MDSQYYLRQCKRGLLYSGVFLINWYWRDAHPLGTNVVYTSLVVASCLLFPYATKCFEQLAHVTRTYSLWHRCFGVETLRNNGFIMLYHVFCLVVALPVGGLYFLCASARKS